jgi:tetratricopeptide (TPR) repeat protein
MENQIRRLPVWVALSSLLLYLCTMGSGLTLSGLTLTAKLAGWDHSPLVGQPLLWLLTLPLHILPAAWVPLGVKLFAAILAAVTLGLLTRTVQLLPWDHPFDGASRYVCALPLLLAGVWCGLEFSFWQEATSSCGEILDLLLLATAIWLLLESKARQQSGWIYAAAVVWGLGMVENWAMLLAVPLFIAGLIWLQRLRFFRWKNVLRLALMGLAGFSLYPLQPMVNGLLPHSPWTLGQAWMTSLHETKQVFILYYEFWHAHRLAMLAVTLFFLVPLLPLLIKIRDEGTQNKSGVDRFQIWLYRGLRAALLLVCLWLALDPLPGPRQLVQSQLGIHLPLLSFDYLNALGAAFLAGNLLLMAQPAGRSGRRRSHHGFSWPRLALPGVSIVLALAALALVIRNGPAICDVNFHPLNQFGDQAVKSLPSGHGIVLSDDPVKLMAFQAALARRHRTSDWQAVDTLVLSTVAYRAELDQRRPSGWLTEPNRHELNQLELLRLLEQMAGTNRIFYLHPSFGYFFEGFYAVPTGTIFELKPRGKNPLEVPPLSAAAVQAGEQFWTGLWDNLATFVSPPGRPNFLTVHMARYGLTPAPRDQNRLLAEWYSIPMDAWAVTLQQQGHLREAQTRFEQVLQLNTNNWSARISLACNTNLQAGQKLSLGDVSKVSSALGNPDLLTRIMKNCGPFDDPTVGFVLGSVLVDHGYLCQAAELFERIHALTPGALAPELVLAEIYNRLQMPERSRPLVDHVREESRKAPANNSLDLDLAMLESYSWLLQTNTESARDVLHSLVKQHPDDPRILGRVMAAYLAINDVTNAMQLADSRLAKTPDDIPSLNAKAMILMQSGRATDAVPILDRILTLTNAPAARINHAFALIAAKDYASAKNDLVGLDRAGSPSGIVDFGLALVAEHALDTNSARHYLQLCLSNSPAGAPLSQQASSHLRMLEASAAPK